MNDLSSKKVALLFPGTGITLCGYETEFLVRHEKNIRPFISAAEEYTQCHFDTLITENNDPALSELQQQLFTYAYSCGMYDTLRERGVTPSLLLPYSLGIYSALYASGAMNFSDGFLLITRAYDLMISAIGEMPCGMGAVIGFTRDDVDKLITKSGMQSLFIVNSNNTTCQIVSGLISEVKELLQVTLDNGGFKAIELPVSIPYHHPYLLNGTKDRFLSCIDKITWNEPSIAVLSSIDQHAIKSIDELKKFTSENLTTPINWQSSVEYLINRGYSISVECGPGISLTQNGRFVSMQLRIVNVKNCLHRLGI